MLIINLVIQFIYEAVKKIYEEISLSVIFNSLYNECFAKIDYK